MPRYVSNDDAEDSVGSDEGVGGFVRGTVKRLLESGVSAPDVARTYLLEQFGGWKTEFLNIFQSEIRRFFDRMSPSDEARKLLDGQRVELTVSLKLVKDTAKPEKTRASGVPGKAKRKKTHKR